MPYRNAYGESLYMFSWLEAKPGSNEFKPATGGNTVWAKRKREAILKVNKERIKFEAENPNHVKLRVDPNNCKRAKTREEAEDFDRGLYYMTI